jgi:hypothetical protein
MAQYNHDPKLVKLVIDGRTIEEYQEGSGITLTAGADVSSTSMGVDFSFTKNINTNIMWDLAFTLQNGSPSNSFLNIYLQTGQTANFMLVDSNTLGTLAVGKLYVKTLPTISGQLEAGGREYAFTAVDVTYSFGGAL